MIEEILKGILIPVSKTYVNTMVDEATNRLDENVDRIMDKASVKLNEMTLRSAHIVKELVPPILYSALFSGAGMLILVLGASAYIDSVLMVEGAGFVIGGVFLLLVGGYYKMQLDKAMEKIEELH
ncbi:hypothetical protein GF412_05175 [Candidatus Micrarchaeota archaeon]|nr:hypothetical protein [Candidatus Micrarchaeota archaeon]MBD3418346.1 hypothetical protein [Candidatus Micrarchaeota archaeon]